MSRFLQALGWSILGWVTISVAYATEGNGAAHIGTPMFVVKPASTVPSPMFTIDRLTGCYGDRDAAMANVLEATNLLRQPSFQREQHQPSVFAFQADTPVCVLDSDFGSLSDFTAEMMESLEEYIYDRKGCEPWECEEMEYFENVPEGKDLRQHLREKYQADYERYKKQRPQEIESAKVQYAQYKSDYESWSTRKEKELSKPGIRVVVVPEKEIPAGLLTLYSFQWNIRYSCGTLEEASRDRLQHKQVSHPAVKAGEQLEIWVDDVDIDLSWGVIFHKTPDFVRSDVEMIENFLDLEGAGPKKELYSEEGVNLSTPADIPSSLQKKMYETPDARSTIKVDLCDEGCSG